MYIHRKHSEKEITIACTLYIVTVNDGSCQVVLNKNTNQLEIMEFKHLTHPLNDLIPLTHTDTATNITAKPGK